MNVPSAPRKAAPLAARSIAAVGDPESTILTVPVMRPAESTAPGPMTSFRSALEGAESLSDKAPDALIPPASVSIPVRSTPPGTKRNAAAPRAGP